MKDRKHRNGNIEILRFLFSLAIVGLHGDFGVQRGYLGVEFFFMLTGAFMARDLDKEIMSTNPEKMMDTIHASLRFIKTKLKKI